MSKEIYISSTPHETRLAIVENDALTEIYYERENEYTLAGSIYNGKVTRVLPGMQSSFVDIGLERDAFLYITDFMEEAGDSADFEASANSGDHARQPRTIEAGREGGGGRDGGGRDGSRNRGGRERTQDSARGGEREQRTPAEPTDADLFAAAVTSIDPSRPVVNQERNRRGGRNRRDRGDRNTREPRRDGEQRSSQEGAQEGSGAEFQGQNEGYGQEEFRTDLFAEAEQPLGENAPVVVADGDQEEVGQGAPGADGSRRWRGRRGRRGARGNREEASQVAPQEQTGYTEKTASEAEPALTQATEKPETRTATGPIDNPYGQAAESSTGNEESVPWDDTRPRRERGERGGRNRRERGGQPAQAPRAPRGFAPSTSLYQVDGAAEQTSYGSEPEEEAPAEAVILPGESLSKYRQGGAAAETQVQATTVAVVSSFVASGWDGGSVLPGETIRPRGPVSGGEAESSSTSRDARGRGERGRDDRGGRGRDDRGGRGERGRSGRTGNAPERNAGNSQDQSRTAQAEPVQQGRDNGGEERESARLDAPGHVLPYLNAAGDGEDSHSGELRAGDSSASAHGSEVGEEVESGQDRLSTHASETDAPAEASAATEQEYEPTEASASYRVDPAPPSEYRKSVVPETAAFAEPEAGEPAEAPADAPEPATDPADLHSVSAELRHAFESLDAGQGEPDGTHEVTTISETGDMHSESEEHSLAGGQDLPELDPPVEDILPTASNDAIGAPASFEPGQGLLEEEEFFEDEYEGETAELPTLHAHTGDEQETLEGAADLASMLRELSIDEITRATPAADDSEEEDEDFLEEDQDDRGSEETDEAEEQQDGSGSEADDAEHSDDRQEQADGYRVESRGEEATSNSSEGRRETQGSSREGRREGRRGERGGDRGRGRSSSSSDQGGSERGSDRGSERNNGGRRDHRGGRNSMQTTSLPAISELLKPGQELLCQIAKEPIAKKGARITSHIALPGRFLVFMPTVSHTGVSRKIESDGERRRLKEILLSEKGEAAGGFIVRTAAAGASEEELRSDLRFLLNLWADIKARSEASKSPALIYHDLNLVERVLRDQVTDTFSAIWVDTETEYERVLRFLQRFQPSLIRRVKLYTKDTPLFEQFGITEEINKALRSKVWLKSGGSIVINQTEALVAIDINTGKFVGKTARLEDTIVKTNLDAIPEIVRQIRLRDLGGIIIIDFIDMDERKNRNKVMAALEEELKSDRAPSKVLPFNDFGLVAITRKRVKQSLERTLSTTCGICAGTGMVKSPVTVCNDIYIEMRKMHRNLDRGDVMLRVNPEVVKQLKSTTSRWLQEMEEMTGKTILVKSDPSLHPEQFDIH